MLDEQNILSALTTDQIEAARQTGVASDGPDVIQTEISAANAKVAGFCSGYTVPDEVATAWARAIAAHNIAARLGEASESMARAFDEANRNLAAVRDGKFPQWAEAGTIPAAAEHGGFSFGGATPFKPGF